MSLGTELFEEITDSITIVGQEEGKARARHAPRFQLQTHVTLLPWNHPENEISVRIRDLSAEGLGILHNQRMPLDDQFVICFPRGEETILALYTIVYWEPLAENLYAIGAHFDRLVEPAEVEARKAELAGVPLEAQRSRFRFGFGFARRRKAS